jgi:hypothetical protein
MWVQVAILDVLQTCFGPGSPVPLRRLIEAEKAYPALIRQFKLALTVNSLAEFQAALTAGGTGAAPPQG